MPIEWRKGADGQSVINEGKAVLYDTETQAVFEVDPAAAHAQNLQLRADLPSRNAEIATLKAELEGFVKIKQTHADLLDKPQEVAAKLKRLADLEASTGGKTVDEQIAALRQEQEAAVNKLRADHAAELSASAEKLSATEKKMTMDKFLLPWQSDKVLNDYRLPRDPVALEFLLLNDEWGKKFVFQQDGKVVGPDGLPMQDSAPSSVLKYILENHPQRAGWKLSTMPEGANLGGTGGGGSASDTETLGTEYAKMNADVISKIKAENPQLHAELMKKHLPNLAGRV